jgi:hypothetical protein
MKATGFATNLLSVMSRNLSTEETLVTRNNGNTPSVMSQSQQLLTKWPNIKPATVEYLVPSEQCYYTSEHQCTDLTPESSIS